MQMMSLPSAAEWPSMSPFMLWSQTGQIFAKQACFGLRQTLLLYFLILKEKIEDVKISTIKKVKAML